MKQEIINFRSKVDGLKTKRQSILNAIQSNKQKETESVERYEAALKVRVLISEIAKESQDNIERGLSEIVSLGMCSIFPNPYEFKLSFQQRRNVLEADLIFIKDGEEFDNLPDDSGGGVLDVASFCLRVGLWAFTNTRRTFIFDEPFSNLSRKYHPAASKLCKLLCDKLSIQIIMVSHSKDILDYADKVFTIEQGELTNVEE